MRCSEVEKLRLRNLRSRRKGKVKCSSTKRDESHIDAKRGGETTQELEEEEEAERKTKTKEKEREIIMQRVFTCESKLEPRAEQNRRRERGRS